MPDTVSDIDSPEGAAIERGVPIMVSQRDAARLRRTREPITFGVPLPRGAAQDPGVFTLRDAGGRPVPTDARVLDRWPDGSIRWLLVDGQVDAAGEGAGALTLERGPRSSCAPLKVRQDGKRIVVTTGRAEFHLEPAGSSPFANVLVDAKPVLDPGRTGITAEDEQGQSCTVTIERAEIEESGALRCVVTAAGTIRRAGGELLVELQLRLHFYAGSPTVRMLVRVRNPKKAEHPNGYWDLGSGGAAYLKDLSLNLAMSAGEGESRVACSPEPGDELARLPVPVALYQDSSGGENWNSTNHLNRRREVSTTFRGYRMHAADLDREGLRATPIAVLERGPALVAVTMPHFWQNFPKAIEASADTLAVRLFPRQSADLHEIQGGEQKTHELFVAFAPDGVTAEPLAWCRSRLVLHAAPDWYCSSGAIPYLTTAGTAADRPRLDLLNAAIAGDDTFFRKREVIDEYGWRHFGDIYGDHEAVRRPSGAPLVSHYNNQYDPVGGFACQFLRSGDVRWWTQMEDLAAHVVDIDIYHTDQDKWAYNHGLFWHTYHYGDADTATHRSYPRAGAAVIGGGGPSPDQNYTTGLMLHHFLTGDPASLETVVDSAQYVLDADDGNKTVFRWLDRGHTGAASASGTYSYHGPGRSPANSLNALVDGYRVSGRRAFLDKAEQLIRRCVHPANDIAGLDLLDAERRWFYTMFLQSLGKYLDDKVERGELDFMYAYGRASLLHYARWMVQHEEPYLERPERLEFPTETWAAQDIRKSDIFYYAMRHATGAEREAFRERGASFFDYATRTLATMPTRTLARPVVLLLSNGALHAWCAEQTDVQSPAPAGAAAFGEPAVFVPQKVRAKKRAIFIAAAGAVILVCALAYVVLRGLPWA